MYSHLFGVCPPTTTPFTSGGDLDLAAYRRQIRFMNACEVHGFVPGGSTGEGHALERDELARLVEATIEEASGKPVIAGIIVDTTRQAIEKAQALAGLGIAGLQVTPPHYLFATDENAIIDHYRSIFESTGLPILIYNVVPWNYLSVETLVRVMKAVDGVIGVKQSNGDLKLFADLQLAAPEGKRIFTAVDGLLYSAFALGAHGAISAMLAMVPDKIVELWNLVHGEDHQAGLRLHRQLLPLWNAVYHPNMCANIKYAQDLRGLSGGFPRAPMQLPSDPQKRAIVLALKGLEIECRAI